MKQCPYCNQGNNDDRENCHFCGGPLPVKAERLEQAYTYAVNALKSSTYSLPSSPKMVTVAMTWPIHVKSHTAFQLSLPKAGIVRNIWIDARATPNIADGLITFSEIWVGGKYRDTEMRSNVWARLAVNHNGLYLFDLPILEPVTCVSDLSIDTSMCVDVSLELTNEMGIDLHVFVIGSQSIRTM